MQGGRLGTGAFEAAARKGDTERLAALFTVDAISMPPDGPFVKGRESIKQLWGGAIQQMGLTDLRLNILDLEIVGGTAYEVGEGVMTLKSGAVTVKYVAVWKNVDGSWRLHREIWNAKG